MMTIDFRKAAQALDMTQAGLASELGVSDRTFRRYVKGDFVPPRGVVYAIMWIMSQRKPGLTTAEIHEAIGLEV